MSLIERTAAQLGLKESQVQAALDLFAEGATIPFVARYRKEQTGGLDEEQLQMIGQVYQYQTNLQERKESVLNLIAEKGLLTDPLKKEIEGAATLAQVEDLYRPFKEKRKTKATEAIAAGLEPLADKILEQKEDPASLGNEKELEGAGYILAERLSDDARVREILRKFLNREGTVKSAMKKDAQDEKGIYQNYYDFSSPVDKMMPHRTLALDRGEKEKVLTVSVDVDAEKARNLVAKGYIKNDVARDYLEKVIQDALSRLIFPSLKREVRSTLREAAQANAIEGFGKNLENILMARPIKGCKVLAWDPGYAHGCKLALLDERGQLLDTEVVYPFRGEGNEERNLAQTDRLLSRWNPDLVVIGNGTASRESERLIAKSIKHHPKTAYVIGSEAGASVYSASQAAIEEFPDLPVEKRSAVSIGRRVQDPLSELVKIDPQSLGVGEYQHDVNQKQLKEKLDFTTDVVVNRVGVNVNTASPALLKHVAGLTKPAINKIMKARPIKNRKELEKLLGPKTFEQAVGFLRVVDGENPLDNTGIHPESYGLAEEILKANGLDMKQMHTEDFKKALRRVNPSKAARELGSDVYTVADIIKELLHPGLDPRDKLPAPVLKTDVLELEDLKPGMELQGTVRNVTSFGAFVDIGLHEDGLVHISRMSKSFVKDPHAVVNAGDIVTVYVVDTDLKRRRISLSMVK